MMNLLGPAMLLWLVAAPALQRTPISADEVTLRHEIYRDARATVFLLDIPPGQATMLHRHDKDLLTVFVSGGRTSASFNGAAAVDDAFAPGDVRFRSAGFTHSTENIGTDDFLAVIFEFVDAQGPKVKSLEAATHVCAPGDQEGCVDRKPLFCTDRFCIDDLTMAPHSVMEEGATSRDRILVAVSDYTLADVAAGRADVVHARHSGEVERVPAASARRWTNGTLASARVIVVSLR
jgi:hypothetical protein